MDIESGAKRPHTGVYLMLSIDQYRIASIHKWPQTEDSVVRAGLWFSHVDMMISVTLIHGGGQGLRAPAAGKAQGAKGHHPKVMRASESAGDGLQGGHSVGA